MEIMKRRLIMRLTTPLIILILIAVFISPTGTMVLAQTDNTTDSITDNTTADSITDNTTGIITDSSTGTGERPIPPGQMKRRGLSGPIVAVGDGSVFILTQFGLVEVFVDMEVDESLIGQRMAVKLAKTSADTSGSASGETSGDVTGEGGGTDNVSSGLEVYRVATAEQFKIIPGKGTKKHKWGTIEETESGCTFIDDEGNSISIECGSLGGDGQVVGLVADNETDGSGPKFIGYQDTSKIEARIMARLAQAEEEGDTKVLERLQQQLERYETRQVERQERAEARAAKRAEGGKQGKGQGQNQGKDKDKGGGGG